MDVVMVVLTFWPEMFTVRVAFLSFLAVMIMSFGLGIVLAGELEPFSATLVLLPIAGWLAVEIVFAIRACNRINELYFDKQYQQNLTYYESMDIYYEQLYDDDDYDETQGLNISPEDFLGPFDQEDN